MKNCGEQNKDCGHVETHSVDHYLALELEGPPIGLRATRCRTAIPIALSLFVGFNRIGNIKPIELRKTAVPDTHAMTTLPIACSRCSYRHIFRLV